MDSCLDSVSHGMVLVSSLDYSFMLFALYVLFPQSVVDVFCRTYAKSALNSNLCAETNGPKFENEACMNEDKPKGEEAESTHIEIKKKEFLKPVPNSETNVHVNIVKGKDGQNVNQDASPLEIDAPGEVMDASILEDDVIRAGGFGARDDLSSFLPVASDSTDFEAMIRDAREYEEPQGEVCRPGLGWKETTTQK
ncbi:hypothetical protein G4B88_001223 [Cannabis sativa]|uniref:Uncharacterized protein n=1 Tax=Cannabis sativa TaxID=3483 RepID=A0A7J6ED28_CANSA|nr:hypothetical protein G4B88_001223 [Cannabis sativa]